MLKVYRFKLILGLMTLQLLFLIIFTFAFVNYSQGRAVLNTGLPINTENFIIMGFSVLSMINIIYELFHVR
ncbi:MAG: hypothetical protein KC535_02445 [Nanoarchaeota archaeon]|nr:hypothetical protein [Nanoarchaeota archaeon]